MVVRLMQAGCMDYEIIISGPAAGADHRRANSVAHFASGAVRADDIICFDGLDFVRIAPAGTDENLVTTLLKAEELSADPEVDIFEFLDLVPKNLFRLILRSEEHTSELQSLM